VAATPLVLLLALPGEGLITILVRAFSANRDTSTPALAAILAAVGLRWAIEGKAVANLTSAFGLAFGAGTAILFAATVPVSSWNVAMCDMISLPCVAAAGLARRARIVLADYREVALACRAYGMEPVVTLHHFTHPIWLAARDDWEKPEILVDFAGPDSGMLLDRGGELLRSCVPRRSAVFRADYRQFGGGLSWAAAPMTRGTATSRARRLALPSKPGSLCSRLDLVGTTERNVAPGKPADAAQFGSTVSRSQCAQSSPRSIGEPAAQTQSSPPGVLPLPVSQT